MSSEHLGVLSSEGPISLQHLVHDRTVRQAAWIGRELNGASEAAAFRHPGMPVGNSFSG
jgi:hypothetical protein